ncbi:MAG: hypothetical protein IK004_09840 [Bacteroidales bacterium]|nr:hypothetical protein [Bacteroidales bacterium]
MLTFIIILVALFVLWRTTHYNDSPYVKERIKGRTDDQIAVIRYFCNKPGFLWKKPMSDQEYDDMVLAILQKNDYRQKALNKIGLDESQVNEIEPVHFEGFQFDKYSFSKKGEDKKWRSSKYQITWLFFSSTQVFLYQNTFNLDEDGKKEQTEEYFYKDITNFSTSTDTVETPEYDDEQKKTILVNVDTNRFALTVPGDKFYCSMEQNDYTEAAIQGMKAMLRDKKNS